MVMKIIGPLLFVMLGFGVTGCDGGAKKTDSPASQPAAIEDAHYTGSGVTTHVTVSGKHFKIPTYGHPEYAETRQAAATTQQYSRWKKAQGYWTSSDAVSYFVDVDSYDGSNAGSKVTIHVRGEDDGWSNEMEITPAPKAVKVPVTGPATVP